ncbi:DNA polymerase III subunit epsilon [Paraferrimonas haliotis]|uniref:DNA-directed DNA polymerase n=1 Tax=Paraferrimonas haliotis TaxID=2013866 RepID=A0AA37WYV0_9GAMM|nr:DNA polymerase III subunit epsilon [Paraferrimonas haliotis]
MVVFDFETTGLSPEQGDRAIEIGAVKLVEGEVVDTFQGLMNPGRAVSSFIESFTGISNSMLVNAPPCEVVMAEFAEFIAGYNLLAHNASFDRKFLEAEFARINYDYTGSIGCTLLTSRRLFQDAPNHKLSTLVRFKGLPSDGVFHRALADAQMTAHLWMKLLEEVTLQSGVEQPSFNELLKLSTLPKQKVTVYLSKLSKQSRKEKPHR